MSRSPTSGSMDDAEVRRLAREVFAPLAAAGVPGRVNRPLVRALGDSGLLGGLFPTPLGGTGGDGVSATALCRLRETLARECTEAETALALQGLGTYPVVQSGSPELGRRVVPAVARGEAVAAFALSEP
ncbi:MAG TPA: acyl-CoA dehydrogenase family protein, partial [Acidimicrobiia bacterium]|nr:acyl-CoA dehydrogenase family protein [Acidimicrobiia bacterium]